MATTETFDKFYILSLCFFFRKNSNEIDHVRVRDSKRKGDKANDVIISPRHVADIESRGALEMPYDCRKCLVEAAYKSDSCPYTPTSLTDLQTEKSVVYPMECLKCGATKKYRPRCKQCPIQFAPSQQTLIRTTDFPRFHLSQSTETKLTSDGDTDTEHFSIQPLTTLVKAGELSLSLDEDSYRTINDKNDMIDLYNRDTEDRLKDGFYVEKGPIHMTLYTPSRDIDEKGMLETMIA